MPTALKRKQFKSTSFASSWLSVIPLPRLGWGNRRISVANAKNLTIQEGNDAADRLNQLAMQAHMMVEAGSWDELHDLIDSFDANCAFHGGRRLSTVAIEGALHPIYPPVQNYIGNERIAMLEDALEARPEDKVLAAIIASAHLSQARDYRSRTNSKRTEYDAWVGYYYHIEKATELMDRFDAMALRSPMIGRLKHRVATHHDYAPAEIENAFENCMALDPTDWEAMGQHARALSRTGSRASDRIEVAARHTLAQTQGICGAASYTAFYLGLLAEDTMAWQDFEYDLFKQGLDDMITLGKGNQLEVNSLAAQLAECEIDGLYALTPELIQNHLRIVVPTCWKLPVSQRQAVLAQAWREDLENGAKVDVGPDGVRIDGEHEAA